MLAEGLWPDGTFDPGAVLDVLARPRTRRVVWFTVWSAGLATVASLLLGVPAAYALHRLRLPRAAGLVRALLLVPFVLPTVVVGVAFRQLLGEAGPLGFLGLDGTPAAIVAGLAFFNVAVVIRAVGASWESLDVRPAEAAAALGASPRQVFLTVTLPALRPALVSAASVVFLFCATSFGIVLTLGGLRYASVETEIYLLTTQRLDLQAAAALSIVQLVAVTVLLALSARLRAVPDPRRRPAGRPPAPAPAARTPRSWSRPPRSCCSSAAPVAALVVGSLRVGDGWGLANYRGLDDAESGQALLVPVTDALVTSLRTAVDATWMALLLGGLVALVVTRRSRSRAERRVRGVLDGFFMLPLGVSAVTLGFGFLITLDEPPLDLRDSPLLVPVAQALVALPLVVRTLAPVLGGIDDRQRQAAASLGAGPLRVLATVDLPVVWKPLLAAAGFAFAVSLGEFGATAFLARDEHPTLPVVIFQLIGRPGADELRHGARRVRGARGDHGAGHARGRAAAGAVGGGVLMAPGDQRRHGGVRRRAGGRRRDRRRPGRLGARGARPLRVRQVDAAARGRRARADRRRHDRLGRTRPRRRTDPQARVRPDVPGRPALQPPDRRRATSATRCGSGATVRPGGRRRAGSRSCSTLVGLEGYADRLPATLSGGERQRVALARSLAVEPRLLLLDEPLSALDAGLRERLAADLRAILLAAGTTALLVTHDHEEAFAVADRIAVMRAGRIVQQGDIAEVWRAPADRETALFLGYARVLDGARPPSGWSPGRARWRYAARHCAWTTPGPLTGRVVSARATPEQVRLVVDVDGIGELDAVAPAGPAPRPGRVGPACRGSHPDGRDPGDALTAASIDSAGCTAAPMP